MRVALAVADGPRWVPVRLVLDVAKFVAVLRGPDEPEPLLWEGDQA